MRGHDSTAEPDRSRDHKRIDRHLATGIHVCEEVTGDSSHPDTAGHDLSEPACQDCVDGLVRPSTAIQLDEHRGRDANRDVPPVRAPHRSSDALMAVPVLSRASEGGDGLTVEN